MRQERKISRGLNRWFDGGGFVRSQLGAGRARRRNAKYEMHGTVAAHGCRQLDGYHEIR